MVKDVDCISKAILNYFDNNISEHINREAKEFILEKDSLSKYDLMRCNYKIKKLENRNQLDIVNFGFVYLYTLSKILNSNLVFGEDLVTVKKVFFETRDAVLDYLKMAIDEEALRDKLDLALSSLGLSGEAIDKIKALSI